MAGYSTPAWANGSAPAISADNLIAMGQGIELSQHPYGVSDTAKGTAAKTVTVDYSGTLALFTGLTVRVKFTNANTAATPTLNVNGTGAKAIKSYGTTAATTWVAGQIIEFVYDGTNWLFDGIDAYTKSQSLSDATATAIGALTGTTPTTPDGAISAVAGAAQKGSRPYCTSSTGAGTVAKVATIQTASYSGTFTLTTGATVSVKFTNANTAASPTLNVASTGAKNIRAGNSNVGAGAWVAGQVVTFVYDGTYWQMAGSAQQAPFVVGTSAPSDTTKLWIDTNNGLKYYNGSAWVVVPVAYYT